jgi:outer membrane protein assembly factor BamD (BamD/ComL family)
MNNSKDDTLIVSKFTFESVGPALFKLSNADMHGCSRYKRHRSVKKAKRKSNIFVVVCLFTLSFSLKTIVSAADGAATPYGALNISLYNDGINSMKASNYALAAKKFLECLKLDPTNKVAKESLAMCYNNWGISLRNNSVLAIEKFHRSLFYNHDNLSVAQNLDAAIKSLGKDPRSFDERIKLALQARVTADLIGAVVEYTEALKIKDDPKAWADMSSTKLVLGDEREYLPGELKKATIELDGLAMASRVSQGSQQSSSTQASFAAGENGNHTAKDGAVSSRLYNDGINSMKASNYARAAKKFLECGTCQ